MIRVILFKPLAPEPLPLPSRFSGSRFLAISHLNSQGTQDIIPSGGMQNGIQNDVGLMEKTQQIQTFRAYLATEPVLDGFLAGARPPHHRLGGTVGISNVGAKGFGDR
jgi:hypothetical protein